VRLAGTSIVSWRGALALLALAGAVLLAFAQGLPPDRVFFQRDILSYWYPMVSTFVTAVTDGGLPVWDPSEGFGLPLWADPASQVGYPVTWLNLVLLPHVVYKIVLLGHALLGATGAFALARRFGLGRLPACVSGIAFATAGPLVSMGSLIHHLCGAAWIPWALWGLEHVLASGSRRAVAACALALGAQALAGSAEMCAMTGLAAGIRLLAHLAERRGAALQRLLPLAGSTAVAFLLAGLQWLPTVAILGATNRRHFTREQTLYWSIHPVTLVDVFVPRLVSEMAMGPVVRAVLYEGREPFLGSLYLGIASLPLVLLAIRSPRRQRTWLAVAFLVFACMSLGRYFPPGTLLLGLPPFSLFRYPAKYAVAAALFWAVLAGLGLEVWSRPWTARDRRHAFWVGGALTVAAMALAAAAHPGAAGRPLASAFQVDAYPHEWMAILASRKIGQAALWLGLTSVALLVRAFRPRWSQATAGLAALVLAADLTAGARPQNATAPIDLVTHRPPALDVVQPHASDLRLLSVDRSFEELNQDVVRGPAGWDREWSASLGAQERISAPSGARWGLRGSYDADFTGIGPTGLPMMSALVRQAHRSPVGVRLLQLGNVGWVIDGRPDGFPLLREAARFQSVYSSPLRVLEVPDPLPPAYVVGGASRAAGDEAAIGRLVAPDFDPRAEVVLSGSGRPTAAPPHFAGRARLESRRAAALVVETDTNAPGFLVVVEAFHPDWRASVDGRPATVERANVLFRGVAVPAGRHRVELRYAPGVVRWAIALGAAGLLIAALLCWKRRPVPRPG
jgi:hypothetical protein